MNFGFILLLAGIITLIIDLILLFLKNRFENIKKYLPITLALSSIFIISSYLIFISSFIFLDFSNDFVYKHTSTDMDIFFRIASSWAGQAGSYFIWAMYVFSIGLIFRILFRKHISNLLYQRMFFVINLNAIALLLLTFINNPFFETLTANSDLLAIPDEGFGLAPVLNTYWNVIHPPIVLLSYALFVIPFAISISRYSLGENEYHTTTGIIPLRNFTMVLAWFIITIGLALGGYWAYVTLGWGGFWAWDPVETSSLVPWIFATIYFHSSPGNKEKPTNFDKDFFAILPFLTVIFATLITRSGLLTSVHTFSTSPLAIGLFIYFLVLFFGVVLVYVRYENLQLFHSWEFVKQMNTQEAALYVTYISLLLGAIGILFGLVIPLGIVILPDPFSQSLVVDQKFFNLIIGIFGFFALSSTLFMDFIYPKLTKNKFYLLFGTVLFGLFLAVISTPEVERLLFNTPFELFYDIFGFLLTTSYLANIIIPIALLSFITTIIGILLIVNKVKLTRIMKIRRISQLVLHLGIVIALIGALYTTNLTTTSLPYELAVGEEVSLTSDGRLSLRFESTEFDNSRNLYVGEFTNIIQIKENGKIIGEGSLKVGRHENPNYGKFAEVLIIPTVFEDIYISVLLSTNQDFEIGYLESLTFQVHIKPLMWVLWAGIIILILSIIPILVISFIKVKNQYNFNAKMESTLTHLTNDSIK